MRPAAVIATTSFSARERSPPMISMPYRAAAAAISRMKDSMSAHGGAPSATTAHAGVAPIAATSERFTARLLRAVKRIGIARVKSMSSISMSVVMTRSPMTAASSPARGNIRLRCSTMSCSFNGSPPE